MGKYLMLWEIDTSRTPVSPRERGSSFSLLLDMVRQDFEKGLIKDWGAFVGGNKGFTIVEGSEVEVGIMSQQYVPFVHFQSFPVASVKDVSQVLKSLIG